MNFFINEAKELVMLAGEEASETTSAGSKVYTPFQPQMGTSEMLMNAGIVMLVVFGVLFILFSAFNDRVIVASVRISDQD